MKASSSRRNFLTASLGLPVTGLGAGFSRPLTLSPSSSPEIRYRTLGKTGLKVSTVGFGCMITSDASVIEKAADLGVNYFDTARGYQGGNNERMVGAALKKRRKHIVLSTKTHGETKQAALADLDTSLRELGTDYVDIWYLHAKSKPSEITEELIDAQETAKKAGKVRFVGVSTHSGQTELIPALIAGGKTDVVLVAFNFTMGKDMEDAVAAASRAGLGVVAMKVMAGGYRRAKPGDKLNEIFKRQGAMVAALKWVLKNPHVHTTVPSITDMDQLDDNLKAMSEPYTEADQKLLASQLERIRPIYCHMCGECEKNCPEGLPIADILRYVMYADGYGQFALGREQFLTLSEEATPARCKLCPTCTVTCPYGVNVARQLRRAQELFA
jgi:predicted aldo/keto reductase-like oxidoreductase